MDEANSGLDVDYSTWETPNEPQPQLGGWQRIAEKMGYHYTDPYMMQRVDARRRQRRSEGLARQIRLDAPAEPTSKDVSDLMGKMDEVMDMMQARGNPRRQVSAPPRPTEPPPKPLPSGPSGRGGIQLP
tara:strand:+ start:28 stop:414 length:387 start_codon:yes stop_codon:yes gene_type:complete